METWSNAKTKRDLRRLYLLLIPTVREIARKSGYAIGVHGSLTRDLDLIAAPWSEKCVSPKTLATRIDKAVCKYSSGSFHKPHKPPRCYKCITSKPHGRVAFTILLGPHAYIDLSVLSH